MPEVLGATPLGGSLPKKLPIVLIDLQWAVERLEAIDGSWRMITVRGRALVYYSHSLAEAIARGYGIDTQVRDRSEAAE
jgi:hypothetical protein